MDPSPTFALAQIFPWSFFLTFFLASGPVSHHSIPFFSFACSCFHLHQHSRNAIVKFFFLESDLTPMRGRRRDRDIDITKRACLQISRARALTKPLAIDPPRVYVKQNVDVKGEKLHA